MDPPQRQISLPGAVFRRWTNPAGPPAQIRTAGSGAAPGVRETTYWQSGAYGLAIPARSPTSYVRRPISTVSSRRRNKQAASIQDGPRASERRLDLLLRPGGADEQLLAGA